MSGELKRIGALLSIAGLSTVASLRANADVLAGNVWPNPTLETPSAITPDDPVAGPAGWHRGGADYHSATPTITQWTTSDSVSPSHSLYDQDHDVNNYAEWFSDFNAVPTGSALTGVPFALRFYWKYDIQNQVHRVSVRWGDAAGNDIGGGPDFLAEASNPALTSFTAVNSMLNPPLTAATFRLTISSGGGSEAYGDLWVDDISAAAVPEPTALAGLATGALLFIRRRRA